MATSGPRAGLAPVLPGRPRVGLLRSANTPPAPADERWLNGATQEILSCPDGTLADPCEVSALTVDHSSIVSADAYLVRVAYECRPGAGDEARFRANAFAKLAANESRLIAAEFETSTVITGNRALRDVAATILSAGTTALLAMEQLEGYLGDCSAGGDGMIHAPRELVARWSGLNLVYREAGGIVTIHGTPVVADAGYEGGEPSGQSADTAERWAYATGPVTIYLSEPDVVGNFAQMDRSVNTATAYAIRAAAIVWDDCCHGAVAVTGF